ncbi:MAG: sigma-70 family RNA polymerase sigma factor [Clostridia bacterium]|nr:sigma-70 family RNA polymerase sigma factor [Clostridia bacterium]
MNKNDQTAQLELINAARAGDESAFEALLEAYEPLIDSMSHSFANTIEDSESYEDLRQEACIAFYRAVQSYDSAQAEVSFGLYAKMCVRNRLISYMRKLRRHESVLPLEERVKIEEDVVQGVVAEEAYMELYRRIESVLSPYESHVWWLYLSGQTTGAIAAQLGKDERSVQNAVYRIRKKLRVELHPNSSMPE